MEAYVNRVIRYDSADLNEDAGRLFMEMGGLDRIGTKYDKLKEKSEIIRDEVEDRIRAQAVCSCYTEFDLQGRDLIIGEIRLTCSAFEQISRDQIRRVFIYFVDAGDFYIESDSVLDQLLADMWGTAFADAARQAFHRQLAGEADLSDEFGPGFYGMRISQMHEMAKLADPALAGITVKESGILVPLKSCAGLFLDVKEGYIPLDDACRDCRGTTASCSFCNVKRRERDAKMFKCTGICSRCGRCKDAGMIRQANERKTKLLQLPEDFTPDTDAKEYGIGFDIGTTTVVGMLWDVWNGRLIGSQAETNPQNEFGLDVISRITFAGEKPENLQLLHDKIIGCLNRILEKLCREHEVLPETILRCVVCGNTTMSHLFMGCDPRSLARAPFDPAYHGTLILKAGQIDLGLDPQAAVLLIPNIAGHVGGDITAGILASRLPSRQGRSLFVDIGTNGEIVYAQDGKMLACSTAAGPAFEGAAIYQGMRAAAGAIERVEITEDDVLFRAIDQIPPAGICGSGLIDAIAQMLDAGLINRKGRIASAEDYLKKHPGSPLAARLRESDHGREFVLVSKAEGEDIVITQQDVREVQLAKAAVAAGIQILMDHMGSSPDQLDRVIIAGAFGSYIDKKSAVRIGLLPDVGTERIEAAGNTAGAGAVMAAAPVPEARAVQQIPDLVQHVELAEDPDFQTIYLKKMAF